MHIIPYLNIHNFAQNIYIIVRSLQNIKKNGIESRDILNLGKTLKNKQMKELNMKIPMRIISCYSTSLTF